MASRCSMSLVSIGSTLTETFGTDPPLPALASDDNALNILPISYPTGQQSNTLALIHDAFQPLSYWNGFMSKNTQYVGVAMDTHIYQMFTDQVHPCPLAHSISTCSWTPHHCRLYRSMQQGISSPHAETREPCLISIIINY